MIKFGSSPNVWHGYGYCAMLAEDYEAFAEVIKVIGTDWDEHKEIFFKKKSWFNYHLKRAKDYLDKNH